VTSLSAAFLRRDFLLARSYRLQFILQLGGIFLTLLSFLFLARLVPAGQASLRPYGGDYFTFVLIGTGVASFFITGLTSFSDTLGREQTTGTLEALLVTPNDSRLLLAGGALWPFCFSAAQLLIYVGAGVVFFGARMAPANLLLVAALLLVSLLAFSALGLLAAAVLVQTKRGVLLVGMFGASFAMLGGVLYPISVLPGWLRLIAGALPMSYGLDGVRRSLLASPDLARIAADAGALILFAAVLLPAALLLFGWSVDRARREGTLGHY
jgi:ABC-2 type transport system permease protein